MNSNIPEGFERLIKNAKFGRLPERTIQISKVTPRVTFSRDLAKFLEKYWGVELFIDRKKKIILMIPSNNEVDSFKITKPSQSAAKRSPYSCYNIFSKNFLTENIEGGIYKVRYNLGRIEFNYNLKKINLQSI